MSQQNENGLKTFNADGGTAIAQYTRVKLVAGLLVAAGVAERGIGVLQVPIFADGITRGYTVRLWNAPGTFKMITAGAVTQYATAYAAASGKVDDASSTVEIGIALESASGGGSIIEILPVREGVAPVSGVGSGYKIARGTATLDGSNPTTVATGLTTIVTAVVSLKAAATPGDDPSWLSASYSGADGNLDIYAYKNTGGTDPTLVASTNATATVDWIAIGT